MYVLQGQTREKYWQRLEIEFKLDKLSKQDLELIDSYYEHKRFLKQKLAALDRDLTRDRAQLRDKTVAMIEQQVEEQRLKLQKDIQAMALDERKKGLHTKLSE